MENNPYAPPSADLGSERLSDTTRYVGFWLRVVASIIDTVLIGIIIFPVLNTIYGDNYWLTGVATTDASKLWDVLISWILPAVAVILLWMYRSATPGKMMIGARIVDAKTGGRPSAGKLVLRYLGYFVAMIPLFIGIVWVAFDARKQGWHDKMAGTVVIKKPK